ncbi:MAG: 16S rRNA (guanine(527)-N(7))-methyltransferase RsmG [Planctomycetota bacterium]|nr:16S rRNA (guanine(527)-N(7))-methyltransferase RsmG [Planctomycetota bacterium]
MTLPADPPADDPEEPQAPEAEQAVEEEEELLYADQPIPSLDELRAAMDWAFEVEDVTPELLDRFALHARMVLDGNRRMNLTAILDPRELAAKQYLDSWRTTQFLPIFGRTVLDLGSGAGFPAMPMAIAEPETKFVALDLLPSRADFLDECAGELELTNLEVVCSKGEDFLVKRRVDIVVARNLSSVRENVRLLRKVRQSMHDLVMLKGKSWSRELRAGEREAERLGFRFDTVWEHELPGDMGQRAILIYRAPGGAGR